MTQTKTLTIPAEKLRVGDRWFDLEERADVSCAYAPRLSESGPTVRVAVRILSAKGAETTSLLYSVGEPLEVIRTFTTDAEHEAALRELLAGRTDEDGSLGQVTNGEGIAALLRLLDEARAPKPAPGGFGSLRSQVEVSRACPYCHGYACPPGGCLNGEVRF